MWGFVDDFGADNEIDIETKESVDAYLSALFEYLLLCNKGREGALNFHETLDQDMNSPKLFIIKGSKVGDDFLNK